MCYEFGVKVVRVAKYGFSFSGSYKTVQDEDTDDLNTNESNIDSSGSQPITFQPLNPFESTITPNNTPTIVQVPIDDVKEWSAGERFLVGQKVYYNGYIFTCTLEHVSNDRWVPTRTDYIIWIPVEKNQVVKPPQKPQSNTMLDPIKEEEYKEWKSDVNYEKGDNVLYNGNVYECIQKHTSNISWTPSVTLRVLWNKI